MVADTYNSSAWEGEARGPEVQMHCEFKVSLGYIMRPCLKSKQCRAGKVTQAVKVLVAKSDDMSSVPRTRMMK